VGDTILQSNSVEFEPYYSKLPPYSPLRGSKARPGTGVVVPLYGRLPVHHMNATFTQAALGCLVGCATLSLSPTPYVQMRSINKACLQTTHMSEAVSKAGSSPLTQEFLFFAFYTLVCTAILRERVVTRRKKGLTGTTELEGWDGIILLLCTGPKYYYALY
jgi:hypothetical protein